MKLKVAVYVREHGSRKYCKAKPKYPNGSQLLGYGFPANTIFCLRYQLDGQRIFETVPEGTRYDEALIAAKRKELQLLTGEAEEIVAQKRETAAKAKEAKTHLLSDAIDAYIKELRENRRPEKSVKAKRTELNEFCDYVKDKPLEGIKRADLIAFRNHLHDQNYAQVTVLNKLMSVSTFLKHNPILSIAKLLKADDWPDKPETEPNPYTDDEVRRMLMVANPVERLLIRFFVGTGMREQEVAHAELSDINFTKKFIQVQPKPKWNWKPKTDAGTRKIPLGDGLLVDLRKHYSSGLLFPNPTTKGIEGHFLRIIQKVADVAGVQKAGCHRFRDTFATDQVRAKVLDLRDIAKMMGHENLEMMKLYAAYVDLESEDARKAANVSDRYSFVQPTLTQQAVRLQ